MEKHVRHTERESIYKHISWEYLNFANKNLIERITASGFDPDVIIGIARGGIIPAYLLNYSLDKEQESIKVVKKENREREIPADQQEILDRYAGKQVLVVEDMLELGLSAAEVIEYLKDIGANVKLVCYFDSKHSLIAPDFKMRTVKGKVIFPWEEESISRSNHPPRIIKNRRQKHWK